jgi:uncharacterized protein DUF3551
MLMRIIIAAAVLLIAGSSINNAKAADPYRWCADYSMGGGDGGTNCYFMTLEQCQAAVFGVGGFCRPNPFYTGPNEVIRQPRKRK